MRIPWELARLDRDVAAAVSRNVPVLISGGSDEARELLARQLHTQGRQAQEPFTKVDGRCTQSIGDTLGRELRGVIFLDPIDALGAEQQSLVCRLLEVGRTCLVVAGSSRDLVSALRRAVFSSTLFYRLNLVHLTLPLEGKGGST